MTLIHSLPSKHQWQGILFSVLLILLMSQLNINLIINGFKISMAIIVLPVLMFLVEDFLVLPVTLLSAPCVLLARCFVELSNGGAISTAFSSYAPEMMFFLIYGLMFAIYTKYVDFKNYHLWYFVPLILIDFISNLSEILIRLGQSSFKMSILSSLLIVAFGRSLLAAILIGLLDYYGLFMLKKDDRERYKKLLLLISQLKSEVVWMDKNTVRIEDTMNVSYQLYNDLTAANETLLAVKALNIAKDVHEIKKEYYLIMRGISSSLDFDMEESGMWLKTIFQILQESIAQEIEASSKKIKININLTHNFYTDKHYFLMSVFRNLLTNAVEATGINSDVTSQITVSCFGNGENFKFIVYDTCGGIPKEYQDTIFIPGFSTKISYETGQVSRGLGLCLVQDIITEQLKGSIALESDNGCTTFSICIPKTILEVTAK